MCRWSVWLWWNFSGGSVYWTSAVVLAVTPVEAVRRAAYILQAPDEYHVDHVVRRPTQISFN